MKANFQEFIRNAEIPVLVDFHAEWCGPCKMMAPVLAQLAEEMKGKLKVIKIDVDKNPQLSQRLNIQGVPTLMLFSEGEVRWRKSGAMPLVELRKQLGAYLAV
ncbi:MAG: thioredoxin [Microscillaceae bacterium]|nr:thioredoxin [Microscillaceae bacterium]